jgi:hypothetical protein
MKFIAHRGLVDGPNKELENHPDQIIKTFKMNFDSEVDVWKIGGELFLGHDEPQYFVKPDFMRLHGLWFHAKNLEALHWLSTTDLHYFWHESDDFTMTSRHYIWTYPGKELTDRSVAVMPETLDNFLEKQYNCYAVCSDYVGLIRRNYVTK